MANLIFIFLLLIEICYNSYVSVIKEFEVTEIVNDTQILLFDNSYTEELDYHPEIIINCLNLIIENICPLHF